MDDGRGYQDGVGGFLGIRVHIPSGVSLPSKCDTVTVTGISRVEQVTLASSGTVDGVSCPAETVLYVLGIWVRGANDISDIGQQ